MRTRHTLAYISVLLLLTAVQGEKAKATTVTTIMGSGIPDDGWTTSSAGNIELALRARTAYSGGALPSSGSTYFATPGFAPSPHNSQANWNWDFSVSTPELFRYDYYLAVDTDASAASVPQKYLATLYPDNSYGLASTPNGGGTAGPYDLAASSKSVMQNSENITFFPQSASLFDPTATGQYSYSLYAVTPGAGPDGTRLAEVDMTVMVGDGVILPPTNPSTHVPDNVSTGGTLMLGLASLLGLRVKRKTCLGQQG